jgi:hypothetical protein
MWREQYYVLIVMEKEELKLKHVRDVKEKEFKLKWCNLVLECIPNLNPIVMIVMERENRLIRN